MREFVFLRHGQTDSNIRNTYLGRTDIPLNAVGIQQAQRLSGKLGIESFDRIYCSPLSRAEETARIVFGNDAHIIPETALMERNFGVWEDLTVEEISAQFPGEFESYKQDWIKFKMKDGESAQDAWDRMTEFMQAVRMLPDEKILFVSHLGMIRIALAWLLNMPISEQWRFRLENCGVVRIIVNDEGYAYLTHFGTI